MMKTLIVLALVVCATALKLPPMFKQSPRPIEWKIQPRWQVNEDKIVGGVTAGINEFPFIISLKKQTWWSSSHICGGTIISSSRVLTAAHCTVNVSPNDITIIAGQYNREFDTDDHEQIVFITDAVEHPDYDSQTFNNDFAVVKLITNLNYNNYVTSIILGTAVAGEIATVAGWGLTSEGGNSPLLLQKLTIPIIDDFDCNAPNIYDGQITSSMVCAGYLDRAGHDSCQGDSGGPLTRGIGRNAILVGVVSWGEGCARLGKPGVYARVDAALAFIRSV